MTREQKKARRATTQALHTQRTKAVSEVVRLREENAQLRAFLAKSGLCLCQSELEDPGFPHLASCPWSDPNYEGLDDGLGACEACSKPATKLDVDGVGLCDVCYADAPLAEDS